jgi:CheY-like chemotaxis protein
MILLVDDNPDIRILVKAQVELLGWACDVAKNGQDAVDSIRRNYYEVILMDVAMPVMNGLDATTAIRHYQDSLKQKPSLIIAMTGQSDLTECLSSGMDDFMQKPVLLEDLRTKLKSYMKH